MKRLSLVLISVALLFGMTQCKKKVETITPAATIDETVHITLDVNGGGKYEVYPSTGAVVYTDGDVIYVGNNGKYVGSLTYANGTFSGTLTGVVTTDYLHFFFVSGLTPSTTPSAGSTASFTVNISDQNSKLPVLSYGKSNIKYTSGTTAYSSILENQCGLVKFVTSTAVGGAITIGGMKTEASINFSGSITPTGTTGGITLYSESSKTQWAILLPQDEVTSPAVTISGSASIESVPEVTKNMYYTSGVTITILYSTGYIDADFHVASDKIVNFAAGNLVVLEGNNYVFDANQLDMHTDVATVGSGYPRYYFKWDEIFNASYSLKSFTIDGKTYTALREGEWSYVLGWDDAARGGTSVSPSGHFYVKANVGGLLGLIILPDNWNDSYFSFTNYNSTTGEYASVSAEQWEALEDVGCVFLPAAGYSVSGSVQYANSNLYLTTDRKWNSSYWMWCFRGSEQDLWWGHAFSTGGEGLPFRLVTVK